MTSWRVVITDTDGPTGVAPVCVNHDDAWVLDCCPGPHIECWLDRRAEAIASALTDTEAEPCS